MANSPTDKPHRVAIYAAPDIESPWWAMGSEWLGRCALRQQTLPQPKIDGMDAASQERITAEPRRYGWHATLKAPFRLVDGVDLEHLHHAVAALSTAQTAFDLPTLKVVRMGRFLALRPENSSPQLDSLAAACVTRLQPLAAPLTHPEMERRRAAGLTPEQDALLLAWGYPWVLDRFRFHFSLTGNLNAEPDGTVDSLLSAATEHFNSLPPMRMDSLSIFVEPTPGADFVLWKQTGFPTCASA
jgi:putative phosphonate metabolism protein